MCNFHGYTDTVILHCPSRPMGTCVHKIFQSQHWQQQKQNKFIIINAQLFILLQPTLVSVQWCSLEPNWIVLTYIALQFKCERIIWISFRRPFCQSINCAYSVCDRSLIHSTPTENKFNQSASQLIMILFKSKANNRAPEAMLWMDGALSLTRKFK